MTSFDPNIYNTPASNLKGSNNLEQQRAEINAEKNRLKRNNTICSLLFIAYGVSLYFVCNLIIALIVGAGKVYNVQMNDVLLATAPFKNLRLLIIPFVFVASTAYLFFIKGNARLGIFILFFTLVMLVLTLLVRNTGTQTGGMILYGLLAPLFLLALYSTRSNYNKAYLFKVEK